MDNGSIFGFAIMGTVVLMLVIRIAAGWRARAQPQARAPAWAVLCRGMLLLGLGLYAALAAGVVIGLLAFFPPGLVAVGLVVVILVGLRMRRGSLGGWQFGTASLATPEELLREGLLQGEGLLVGKIPSPSVAESARILRSAPLAQSRAACRVFLDSFRKADAWVRINKWTNAVAFSPPGGGKSQGIALPVLRTHPGSMVVLDPKGELAKASADYRRKRFAHKIIYLDPFRVVSDKPATLNPLDGIDPSSDIALDLALELTQAVVVRDEEEREKHWNDNAETHVWGVTGLVLDKAKPAGRNLQTVATILNDPLELQAAIREMQASTAWGGGLARIGGNLTFFQGDEAASVRTTTSRHLRFLTTPAVGVSTRSSNFDPAKVRDGKMTAYLIVPSQFLASHSPLLRLWLTTFLREVVQGGTTNKTSVLFLIDEAAALGHLPCIDDAIARLRGYGLSTIFLYQSMGQLQTCYPNGRDQTFLASMDVQLFAALNDYQTADYVSRRLGEATIEVATAQGGSNRGVSRDYQGLETVSSGTNTGWSVSQTARQVLKPEEVLALHAQQAVVCVRGVTPFISKLVRAYEPEFQDAISSPWREFLALAGKSLGFLLLAVAAVGVAAATALPRLLAPVEPTPVMQQPVMWPQQVPWPGP